MVRRVQGAAMQLYHKNPSMRPSIVSSMLSLYETHLYTEEELQQYLEAIERTGGVYCQGKKRGDGFSKFYYGHAEYYTHHRDAFIANIYLVYHNLNPQTRCAVPKTIGNVLAHLDGRIEKKKCHLRAGRRTDKRKKSKKCRKKKLGRTFGLQVEKEEQTSSSKGIDTQNAM